MSDLVDTDVLIGHNFSSGKIKNSAGKIEILLEILFSG